ncbi:conserved hypothetical protein [Coccidioides posadasii str. Silveira]|uniref:Uncharacterized protein n=2 Tax=Coccidioides posadasii TaxID=199306 RepID=E9DF74_COCPS|nr:conserved hypothetical protein [Coccidioides posadasii str. Silveira]KMM70638.1 hypothetical protein CPAG_06949 [Coccidioides posadasii RMSCC 3488]
MVIIRSWDEPAKTVRGQVTERCYSSGSGGGARNWARKESQVIRTWDAAHKHAYSVERQLRPFRRLKGYSKSQAESRNSGNGIRATGTERIKGTRILETHACCTSGAMMTWGDDPPGLQASLAEAGGERRS